MPDVPVFLCGWHVKQAWVKQLVQKVTNEETRKSMGAALDKLMRLNVADPDNYTDEQLQHMIDAALEQFYKDFAGEAAFIKYFKDHWDPKASECMCGLGNVKFTLALSLPDQNMCAGARDVVPAVPEHVPLQPGNHGRN